MLKKSWHETVNCTRFRYTGTFLAKYQESTPDMDRPWRGTRLMSKKTLKAAFFMFFDLSIAMEKNHPKRLAMPNSYVQGSKSACNSGVHKNGMLFVDVVDWGS